MDRFVKKWQSESNSTNSSERSAANVDEQNPVDARAALERVLLNSNARPHSVEDKEEVDISRLPADPAKRKPISQYKTAKVRDDVRRAYLRKGPFQPVGHDFPQTDFSGIKRRFNEDWFKTYKPWLEYSIKEDAAFCLCCYLFQNESLGRGGGDVFSTKGWKSWNNLKRLDTHVGGPSSSHNQNMKSCDDLMNQKQSIAAIVRKQTQKSKIEYKTRLIASIDIARLLLTLGLPFRGHDESESSLRKGNFLTFYEWYAARCPDVAAVALKNAPKNLRLVSSTIQKDIVESCAIETIRIIIEDLGDEYFAILVDESRDVSHKEQMALAIRYVDKRGFVVERIIGLSHVTQTTSLALQQAIYSVLEDHNLSPSRIRGQGYDGSSNMQGHLNGLKTLVMEDSRSAHSIHCFAHQLQLTLVAVAKNHEDVVWLFEWMSAVLSIVGNSFKNRDMLREKLAKQVEKALQMGELETGRGLNQELGLKRPDDTRWGSHFSSLKNMIVMFPSVIEVIDDNAQNSGKALDRIKAKGVLDGIQTFDFVFMIHLMKLILGITNELNIALQRKDQDIVNVVSFLGTTKRRLQEMRNQGWEDLFAKVNYFCLKHGIQLPDMNAMHIPRGSISKRKVQKDGISNKSYYQSVTYAVIDLLRVELNDRFSESSTTLLLGMACLDPSDSFSNFEKDKVLAMARLYPDDFESESKMERRRMGLEITINVGPNLVKRAHLEGVVSDVTRVAVSVSYPYGGLVCDGDTNSPVVTWAGSMFFRALGKVGGMGLG